MRRSLIRAICTLLWGLGLALLAMILGWYLGLLGRADAEQGAVRIQGRTGQIAEVNHAGALQTAGGASGGGDAVNVFHQSTVAHVSSVTHVVILDWQRWAHLATAQSGTWTMQAHQAGQWNVAHVSSATHVVGRLSVDCLSGCSGGSSDAVNVFHQSTVRHVSSVTHVVIMDWQRWAHLQASQSGAWTVQAAHLAGVPSVSQGTVWAVLAHAQQSGSWTVQAAHQGGTWNTGHVAAVTHVMLLDLPRFAHIAAEQSGIWTIQAAHQGGQWNVAHITARSHVMAIEAPAVTRAAVTSINAALTNTTLLEANHARVGLIVYDDASVVSNLFLKLGSDATTSSFTVVVPDGGFWQMTPPVYTGPVHGIWDVATGAVRITEITR